MSFQGKLSYGGFVLQTIKTWTQIRELVMHDSNPAILAVALERLAFLSNVVAIWPVHISELRHQNSLLILLEDTILWVSELAQGNDGAGAERDMSEAVMAVHVEVGRLAHSRRGGQP